MIKIIRTGTDMRLVDMGRPGYASQAIPIGGAMDMRSALQVHSLMNQDYHAPLIEISGVGAAFYFSQKITLAIGGAHGVVMLSNQEYIFPCVLSINAGERLEITTLVRGYRSYMSVPGLIVETWLGSVCHLWPYLNGLLRRGEVLLHRPIDMKTLYCVVRPIRFDVEHKIVCSPGPEYHLLTTAQKKLLDQTFNISKDANTMGYRLQGRPIKPSYTTSIISSAVLPGTVQLLPNGQLVILMRDCQTTGGYPRILQIEEEGICELAQRRPGNSVQFSLAKTDSITINRLNT